jgi:hypothetical protein
VAFEAKRADFRLGFGYMGENGVFNSWAAFDSFYEDVFAGRIFGMENHP